MFCNAGFAEYFELNKCFTLEQIRSGEVKKIATHFEDTYNYSEVTEANMKYLSKYYKVGDKIKQYEDVLYTIDTSAELNYKKQSYASLTCLTLLSFVCELSE